MNANISAATRKVMIVTLLFAAVAQGQNKLCQEQTADKGRGAPEYRIGDSWRPEPGAQHVALQISIKPKHFNREDMMALARRLKQEYCDEQKLVVYIFDSYQSAQTFSIISHSPTYKRDFLAYRGFYFLERNIGKEYIQFSSARKRPRDEIVIEISGNSQSNR